ncbi:hypothetical protein HMPREF0762_00734 [Slackia exigua ATCC 700122]|uniref:Uncharacterized protein n=1 Tax=Slackia exigua (strain ATCC 700122 / DSM 15923 / CIP 105133 / JCM 11022 / KCTC 5966 / S-7) TaxID=649764 RepID=D0WFY4_SLAES|nr:hypothetical protein HMPREF0762_00734 [Slackia exigua ATCC 700122]
MKESSPRIERMRRPVPAVSRNAARRARNVALRSPRPAQARVLICT